MAKIYVSSCTCGAVTFETDNQSWSMSYERYKMAFDDLKPSNEYVACNYCVNHWGIDICACGSGKPYWKCKGRFSECGKPMQDANELMEALNGRSRTE